MPNQALRGLKAVASKQREGMPPRDFPARGQQPKPKLNTTKENIALREAALLSKLPSEGIDDFREGRGSGVAISPAYFNNPEALRTVTDVWNQLTGAAGMDKAIEQVAAWDELNNEPMPLHKINQTKVPRK